MTIDVWQVGHLAVIDISDNGPSIDNSIRDRIFSAFTTGHSSHIGLGLAICLDLALALEGRFPGAHRERGMRLSPAITSGDFAKLSSGCRQSAQMGAVPSPKERKSRYLAILR